MQDFTADLAIERQNADAPIWGKVYTQLYPNTLVNYERCNHPEAQKLGIDRILTLEDTTQITVEEKIRYKDYNDVALEFWSNKEEKTPGWCLKDLKCDYVLYLFWNSQKYCYMPFTPLRKIFEKSLDIWKTRFKVINTINKGNITNYTTVSVCVPIPLLSNLLPEMKVGKIAK